MHKYSLFSIIKERHLYSRKNSRGTPENRENRESLAQQIFSRLRYIITSMYYKYRYELKEKVKVDDDNNVNTTKLRDPYHGGSIKMDTNPAYGTGTTIKMDIDPAYATTS